MSLTERDRQIPRKREDLKRALEEDLQRMPGVIGLFYGGSVASGSMDFYSDLDVRVVTEDEAFERVVNKKKIFPDRWGKVLFYEDIGPSAPYTIAHYDGFFKVDVFIYRVSDLQPGIWLKDLEIVYDPSGRLQGIREESIALSTELNQSQVEKWRGKTLAYVHEAYRRAAREEWYYALQCVDAIRWSIAAGWQMEQGMEPNNPLDWAKLEGSRSPLSKEQQQLLAGWWVKERITADVNRVLLEMKEPYISVETVLAKRSGLKVTAEDTRRIWEMAVSEQD
ncbi:hypothetical protein CR205_10125 [Alteribacter lacisalsi]|uniref:Polymerase nucleotidyl transferase domain-containing protein n=1 Tax=Alteribacter lacisalsi TaxID=2045244 RepID=A0A2W0HAL7_9BACI|nr:nucleotidyltransferase domain-containing protein [Alteribacter lacisalsi]PYZ98903.1 hypothetical protein CR205_10125 [Alteribacter lacisalsi]